LATTVYFSATMGQVFASSASATAGKRIAEPKTRYPDSLVRLRFPRPRPPPDLWDLLRQKLQIVSSAIDTI
jgi:hypothetical protein